MMHSWKLTTKAVSTATSSLLNGNPNLFFQQTRTTYILKRKHPPRLYKKEDVVRKLTRKDFYYDVVENTDIKKRPLLDIILTEDIKNVGYKGEKIKMKPNRAYNQFLLPGLAVYATPENIEKYDTKQMKEESKYSSKFVPQMLEILSRCCLIVYMNSKNKWTLEKRHVRINFRTLGIHLTDESITMPKNIISGPNFNYQGKEFYVTVCINKTETVNVRCRLHHIGYTEMELHPEESNPLMPAEAIFPEDQPILDSLPRPKWEDSVTKT